MPTVEVTFTPLPAHVRTARLVATAVARRSGVEEALLDEVRLELTDRAGRFEVVVTDAAPVSDDERVRALTAGTARSAAGHHGDVALGSGPALSASAGRVGQLSLPADVVSGRDGGLAEGFGLAVITGLADDVQISATDNGISVRMSWPTVAT